MGGERIRLFLNNEVTAILTTYKQFETLIPAENRLGSAHSGEDGRFVEELIREYLRRFLPAGLEVLTGFILRPAVKTGEDGRERKKDKDDKHSTQLDIIVYDSINYPIIQRFGNSAIVPPEGVIAIISVKKTLRDNDIEHECRKLGEASKLCDCKSHNNKKLRGPYLALISMSSDINKGNNKDSILRWVFEKIKLAHDKETEFTNLIGLVGVMGQWSIFKARPPKDMESSRFVGFKLEQSEEHFVLQQILTGILSVFYDESRRNIYRPGYTAFHRKHDIILGEIKLKN